MRKRIVLFTRLMAVAAILIVAACSFSPFKGTRLSSSEKLNKWWTEAEGVKYYSVDFATFRFTDISRILNPEGRLSEATVRKINSLLIRVPENLRRGENWVAVFDNRRQFCGILSENMIVADAGIKHSQKGQVYMNMFLNTLHLPAAHYIVDNIDYYTDSIGRIKKVFCKSVILKGRGRNSNSQRYSVQFKDGRAGDDAGHLIPQMLYGPAEQINYVPQKSTLNRGKIKALEDKAAKAKRAGYNVSYEIHILYRGAEKRPYGFENNVKMYSSDGKLVRNISGIFDNE